MSGLKTYKPRFGYDIRIHPDVPPPRPQAKVQPCSVKGCIEMADTRAPRTREHMDERVWLCRAHLRAHNESWDYFAGMSEAEIERHCLEAIVGHRPTWPLGKRAAAGPKPGGEQAYWSYKIEDGFAIFEESAEPARRTRPAALTKGQQDALAVLDLEDDVTLVQLKARYKELVKRFHPDTNGGNRATEDRLRVVIKAYAHLRATGFPRSGS
jgi:hypothetical protein